MSLFGSVPCRLFRVVKVVRKVEGNRWTMSCNFYSECNNLKSDPKLGRNG